MLRVVLGAALIVGASAAHWAVIMAGSNGYGNYRHQADACHAYQVAAKSGIPESNIILLAYDDIASSSENPFPGKVFNKPNGTDVYAGCKIAYKGKDVTAANFLKVLRGDASASGPVLKSTAQDRVFIYYADHGGPGILGVPSGAGDYIHAADVNAALSELNSKNMYKEVLFYLEACESGSIFSGGLLKAPRVKAVTAANPSESSWGWYCPPQDKVQGKSINSCLGDEFSIHWMEDSDAADLSKETVGQQAAAVTKLTTKSHVQQYGDADLDSEVLGVFEQRLRAEVGFSVAQASAAATEGGGVPSRDVELHLAYWTVHRAQTAEAKKLAALQLEAVLVKRRSADAQYLAAAMAAFGAEDRRVQEALEGPVEQINDVVCHKNALRSATQHCGQFDGYSMRYSRLLAHLCDAGLSSDAVDAALRKGCSAEPLASCTGSADPPGTECYTGKAGALGVTETVNVNVRSYSAGKGTMDLTGSGIEALSCLGKSFTKSGQDLAVDLGDCLPSAIKVSSVKYCSDTDAIAVTVEDSRVPLPISTTLKKVACSSEATEGQLVV